MKILTKKRKEILDLLLSSEKPMCANMLKKYVTFNLSTIYRALEYLESNNFISSFYFGNEKYYFKEKNGNFFLCESCNTIEVVPSEVRLCKLHTFFSIYFVTLLPVFIDLNMFL